MQVALAAMMVDTAHPAFEDRKEAFNGVGINCAANIFTHAMFNNAVPRKSLPRPNVVGRFVSVPGRLLGDVGKQDRGHGRNGEFIDNHAFSAASFTVYEANDIHLVVIRAGNLGARFAANKVFIDFNDATARAKVEERVIAHCFTDAVRHEPSRFQGHTKSALQLVAAETLLAGTHQIDCLQPQVHGDVAAFKDSTDLDSEWLAARVALIHAYACGLTTHFAGAAGFAAMRAHPAIRPKARFHISVCGFLIVVLWARKDRHDGPLSCTLNLGDACGYVKYNIAL